MKDVANHEIELSRADLLKALSLVLPFPKEKFTLRFPNTTITVLKDNDKGRVSCPKNIGVDMIWKTEEDIKFPEEGLVMPVDTDDLFTEEEEE